MVPILITAAAIIGAGAWLRWAVIPVRIAYDLGRLAEALCAQLRQDGRPGPHSKIVEPGGR